jgi:hypothetical protein
MSTDADAVIAALRVVLQEVERRDDDMWEPEIVNKWIHQLPGDWAKLELETDDGTFAERENLLLHVRATLAFLESHRDAGGGRSGGGDQSIR